MIFLGNLTNFLSFWLILISPNPKDTSLKVRESPAKGVWVDGLHEEFIGDEEDIANLLTAGEAARTVSSTDMNARSSRSHR